MTQQQLVEITDPIIAIVRLDPQCAWCLKAAGQPLGEGSHGICLQHSQTVFSNWQAARLQRKQQKH